MEQSQGGFPTYGELLPSGVDALLQLTGMDEDTVMPDCWEKERRKVALSAPVKKAVGIELSPTRLEYGIEALKEIDRRNMKHAAAPVAALSHFFCDSGVCWLPPYYILMPEANDVLTI
eukprot:768130-Hanusia_phi.AAC.3